MVGLLDVKTLPKRNWLENYLKLIIQDNKEIIFGKTKYTAKNFKQKIISIEKRKGTKNMLKSIRNNNLKNKLLIKLYTPTLNSIKSKMYINKVANNAPSTPCKTP